MAFPVVANTTITHGSSGTSHAIAFAASSTGDVLVITICVTAVSPSITTPSGWTLLGSVQVTATKSVGTYYRNADGFEGTSVTFTHGSGTAAASASRITGSDTATAPVVAYGGPTVSTNPNPPSNTPGWGALDTLWLVTFSSGGGIVATVAPSGFGNLLTGLEPSASAISSADAQINASPEDPGTFTAASATWITSTVGIKPMTLQAVSAVGAIASGEAFGTVVVTPGAVAITDAGAIASGEAFGTVVVAVGAITLTLAGIASAEAFGTTVVVPGAVALTAVGGIASAEAFGTVVISFTPQAVSTVGAIATEETFGTVVIVRAALPPVWPAVAEYVVEILDSSATFGPGAKLGELWDLRNLGWSAFDRIPGKGFFTLSQRSSLLSLIAPLTTHVRIWRLTPRLTTLVYTGAIIDYDAAGDDVVFSAFDYNALLSLSRSGYRTLYPVKAIGSEIVSPEWVLAKGATSSPLGFVATGTIEDPLGTDNATVIKTNNQFGLLDQMRLQLFFDLSEIGRANTVHNTTFEITRSATPTFNFWKDKGSNIDLGLVLGGNVSDYRHLPNWTAYRNDLATLGSTVGGGATEVVVKDDTAAAAKGRRQDVFTIKTLLGIAGSAVVADQQVAAANRMLKSTVGLQPALQLDLLRGSLDLFDGWDICDMPLIEIGNGIDTVAERWRIVGAHATFDESGESSALVVQPIAT